MKKNLEDLATLLHQARKTQKPVPQLTKSFGPILREEAYTIQEAQKKLRLKDGEVQVGWKMGLTSKAKRKQMNLDSPLYGFLTDKMKIESEGSIDISKLIHPKIEPEIAFLIAKDLEGDVTREEAIQACSGAAACLEILDSRYDEFKYFSMEDVIADNSSSSHFIIGNWMRTFRDLDLRGLNLRMSVNGEMVQSGISKDISGDPIKSIRELCRLLALRGQKLEAGSIVLAGAATPAVELKPGMLVKLTVEGLGDAFVTTPGV